MNFKNRVGMKSGMLTPIHFLGSEFHKQATWICICECGNFVSASSYRLDSFMVNISCGCHKRERKNVPRNFTDRSWRAMIARCNNPKTAYYEKYGGAGVTVCDRWNPVKGGNLDNFIEDMGYRPEGTTLNRINGAKIYSKETCEWTTPSLQSYDTKLSICNKSGTTGVFWNKKEGKWQATIDFQRKKIYLGQFKDLEEAIDARKMAELKYYGFHKGENSKVTKVTLIEDSN